MFATVPVALSVLCFLQATDPPPDPDLHMRAHVGGLLLRPVYSQEGKQLTCQVNLNTVDKKVQLMWLAKAGVSFPSTVSFKSETTTFYPTAFSRSFAQTRSFFIVGRNSLALKLERWTISDPISIVGVNTFSGSSTQFQTPTIQRTSLSIDQTLGDICAMTVVPRLATSGEELWVMEYSTRNVYAIDLDSGAKALRLSGLEVGEHRRMWINKHTDLGLCVWFSRIPTWLDPFSVPREPDQLIKIDADLDGVIDSTLLLPLGGQEEEELYGSGGFELFWPDIQ